MKYLISALILIGFPLIAAAKYTAPEGIVTRSDKITNWQIKELDDDGDGKLTADEFKKKVENYGREERRNVRRAQKEGKYISPEAQFKAMDVDKDGKVSDAEMADYVRKQREESQGVYY